MSLKEEREAAAKDIAAGALYVRSDLDVLRSAIAADIRELQKRAMECLLDEGRRAAMDRAWHFRFSDFDALRERIETILDR